jgi:hypothetical protein
MRIMKITTTIPVGIQASIDKFDRYGMISSQKGGVITDTDLSAQKVNVPGLLLLKLD